MSNETFNLTYQNDNNTSSIITQDNSMKYNQQRKDNTSHMNLIHQRRLSLPNKLSFEQNITNLIEKESPLLKSELLTTEHELSLFRSRLTVNESVTAVTGAILESLKGHIESYDQVNSQTSTIDTNLVLKSSSSQTSPTLEILPEPIEIHYDRESSANSYLLVKAINSYWIAQPIKTSDVEMHLKTFSSPIIERASIKLPEQFYFNNNLYNKKDFQNNESLLNKISINTNYENVNDQYEEFIERKTLSSISSSSSINEHENQFDKQLNEIYFIIDCLKYNKLNYKLNDLKLHINNIHFNKQEQLNIKDQFDKLKNLSHQTLNYNDYRFIQLYEQNLNKLKSIIKQIQINRIQSQKNLITQDEDKFESIKNITKNFSLNNVRHSLKRKSNRLISESRSMMNDNFFQSKKEDFKRNKSSSSTTNHLIPENARISAESFYEGDIHRSLYQHVEHDKQVDHLPKIPSRRAEKSSISSENFYESNAQRSSRKSSSVSIDNLREIMSDLMLAASWSKKPKQMTSENHDEILAESFITTEQRNSIVPYYEVMMHEIENLPLSRPLAIIVEQSSQDKFSCPNEENNEYKSNSFISESSRIFDQEENTNRMIVNERSTSIPINVETPSLKQENDHDKQQTSSLFDRLKSMSNDNISSMIELSFEQIDEDSYSSSSFSQQYDDKLIDAPVISRVQRSSIISKTITSCHHDEENDFHSTHFNISNSDENNTRFNRNIQYDKLLIETANNLVEQILNESILQIIEYEQNCSLSIQIVNNAMENSLNNYDKNLDLILSSATSSDNEEEYNNNALISSSDDEENESLIPQISDQPYLFVNDVSTSKSTQELSHLVQELQILEYKIPTIHSSSSSSSSSLSDNQSSISQIMTTKSVNELTNRMSELENIEDQFDSTMKTYQLSISPKSFNELDNLMNELDHVSKQLNHRLHEEIFTSTNIEALSQDIVKYRRESQSYNDTVQYYDRLQYEQMLNPTIQIMIDNIIKEVQNCLLSEVNFIEI